MRSDLCCGCFSSRVTSICVGVVTTLLWLPFAGIMMVNVHETGFRDAYSTHMAVEQVPLMTGLLCFLTSSALSALMVSGAVKSIASYMFPWLAIHFVLLLSGTSLAFSFLLVVIFNGSVKTIFLMLGIFTLVISPLMYFWSVVYLHYKRLHAQVQVESSCRNEGKILKVPNEPENPYHPV